MVGRAQLLEGSTGSAGTPGFAAISIRGTLVLVSTELEAKQRTESPDSPVQTPANHPMIWRQACPSEMGLEEGLPSGFLNCPAGCRGRDGERQKRAQSRMDRMIISHWDCPMSQASLEDSQGHV